ncbi:MAG: hypothetical protein K6B15_07415 [Parasporobacterium sp.]|nr:hypothetical protein [Parasporobacterium sp.]
MIAASSLALTLFLLYASFANIFGVGGGSLMVRFLGDSQASDFIGAMVSIIVFVWLKKSIMRES